MRSPHPLSSKTLPSPHQCPHNNMPAHLAMNGLGSTLVYATFAPHATNSANVNDTANWNNPDEDRKIACPHLPFNGLLGLLQRCLSGSQLLETLFCLPPA